VALFHNAARVQELDIPKGTEISAHLSHETEDGPEVDYRVYEEIPPKVPSPPEAFHRQDFDERAVTLKLHVPSLAVHYVSGITFQTEAHSCIAIDQRSDNKYSRLRTPEATLSAAECRPMAICAGAG
jgi:hypothetical protein